MTRYTGDEYYFETKADEVEYLYFQIANKVFWSMVTFLRALRALVEGAGENMEILSYIAKHAFELHVLLRVGEPNER